MRKRPLKDRLYEKVDVVGDCWNFTGYINPTGYGRIGYGRSSIPAHRASWLCTHGELPEDLYILHTCDNPACINPDHLYAGTQFDNMKDMVVRGRSCGNEIKARVIKIYSEVLVHRDLALHMGIHPAAVCKIAKGYRWGHVL